MNGVRILNRKQKKELRQRQTTRQLMGISQDAPQALGTDCGERDYFPIQPDNPSALSP